MKQTSRWACVSALTFVFVAGVASGAAAISLGGWRLVRRQTAPFWTEAGKAISLERWKRELALTPEQTQEMESILDDFGMYYRNLLSDGKSRILKILDDDQKKKFDKLLGGAQQPKPAH
jgi:hypothetical protein